MTETGTSTTIDLSGLIDTAFNFDPVITETNDADVADAT